ncbi:hypothetical protein LOTGIDRAFT_176823, partial [Lottia gigantea]
MASGVSSATTNLLIIDNTVKVILSDNVKLLAADVIKLVEDKLGDDSVLAIVPCNGSYDVTVVNNKLASVIARDGLLDGSEGLHCKLIDSRVKVVSFMHIPVYVSDKDIEVKLKSWGVTSCGPIIRKTKDYDGKKKYDGTRFVKVEFPPTVCSLPYATVFDGQSYSVRHNDQEKVCFICLLPGHVVSNCPEFKCFRCYKQGHGKKSCTSVLCPRCNLYDWKCQCLQPDDNVFTGAKNNITDNLSRSVVLTNEVHEPTTALPLSVDVVSVSLTESGKVNCDINAGRSSNIFSDIDSTDNVQPITTLSKNVCDATDQYDYEAATGCEDMHGVIKGSASSIRDRN